MDTKHVPLALFSAFCLKALVVGITLEVVACLAVLGAVAFLYETFIQNKSLKALQNNLAERVRQEELSKKEIEQVKAYISSLKLNTIRGPGGFNRAAQ